MILLIAAVGAVGAVLFPSGRRFGRRVYWIAAVPLGGAFVWLLTRAGRVVDGRVDTQHVDWVPALGVGIDLRLDGFGLLMALLVTGIGTAVCAYAAAYFSETSGGLGRSAGLLLMFAAAMLVVVLSDNLLLLYTGWELTSITSYLLIGNDHTKLHARAAALQALLITSLGGLVMLAGFVLVGQAAGTYRLSEILADPPGGRSVQVGVVLMLIGAFTKSAQYPFHSWLPSAMAAPTPVSAYLHSATMVKAGVYLIGRLAPAFSPLAVWRPLVLTVGIVTMVVGGLRALRQHDLKLLLAFGTVSQLGFLVVLFGAGVPEATAAGCALLIAHALFKAALFMAVGTIDRHLGTRDLRRIPALGPGWRSFKVVTVAAAASMAGVPLLFGFVGKEAGFAALDTARFGGAPVVLTAVVAGSIVTAAYSARFVWGMFGPVAGRHQPEAGGGPLRTAARPGAAYGAPLAVLVGLTVFVGVLPARADSLVGRATRALDATADPAHLALWHGVNLPLVLSGVALAGGALAFRSRDRLDAVLARGAVVPTGTIAYLGILRITNTVATRVTGVVQSGSLPVYAGTTLLTAAVVPGWVLLDRSPRPDLPRFASSPGEVMVVAAVLAAAIATATVRRRFSAALFLGVVGYAMAGLFVVQGAPDLALTQVAIETLSTVLFVLVLRRLPDRFERTSTARRRVLRVVVSAGVGAAVLAFALVSRAARTAEPVSTRMIERSVPDGHGRNVVNVILVDIRALDTMAEITVLASAAIGAVALARVGRRRRPRPEEVVS